MSFFQYLSNNWQEVLKYTLQHIELSAMAVFIAIVVGVPLGILISHYKKLSKPVIGFANVVQAIPSLALLGFAIPFLGIGMTPAIFMVLIYSLLPIIKNTHTGISNINPQTIEAARGIGMSRWQIMFMVEFPLALPVIMTGVRVSSVTAIGLVTIAAFVGAGGLGYLVFAGIQTVNNNLIIAGAIPACILALMLDYFLGKVENLVKPLNMVNYAEEFTKSQMERRKFTQKLVLASIAACMLAVFAMPVYQKLTSAKIREITVGSKDFTEQTILGHIFAELVERKTDIKVNRQLNLGGTSVVFTAMKSNLVDVYIEYTGTAYINVLEKPNSNDAELVYGTVKDEYARLYDISWLEPLGFNNTYTITVREGTAKSYNLKTISDLAKVSSNMVFSPTIEFSTRPDGLPKLKELYNMDFKDVSPMNGSLRYTAIENDSSQIVDAFATDGLLKEFNLVILKDDKNLFPPYYAAPIVRNATLKRYPELAEVLDSLAGKLTEEVMIDLNHQVDVLKRNPEDVAEDFLIQSGYITAD